MKQPISAITNIAYVAVGAVLIDGGLWPAGVSLFLLAIASFLYHATGVGWTQKADEMGVYLVFWSFIGLEISSDPVFTGWFAASLAVYMGFTHDKWDSFYTAPLLFGVLTLVKIWQLEPLWYVIAFAVAALFAFIGRNGPYDEDPLHGIWHLLTAYGFLLI